MASAAPQTFTRLVRFLAPSGSVHYGDLLPAASAAAAQRARVITGNPLIPNAHSVTSTTLAVSRLLCPLAPEQVRTVRCLGLNYRAHAAEIKVAVPQRPVLFYKPPTALAGPEDDVVVPRMAQEGAAEVDYECELVVVIGRDGKDIALQDALDHVLGYAVGNDVSQRALQFVGGGHQWSLGKGFDGWAPLGPTVVRKEALGERADGRGLRIGTRINGEQMQDSNTADMIFDVREIVSFLSRGTTLVAGDVIFTGTPQGVGTGRNPKRWLKDGEVVEVEIEGIGVCRNKVVFEKQEDGKANL